MKTLNWLPFGNVPALSFEFVPCSCITHIIFKTGVMYHKKLKIVTQNGLTYYKLQFLPRLI